MARLRSVFCRRITDEEIDAIAVKLIAKAKAKAGDVAAAADHVKSVMMPEPKPSRKERRAARRRRRRRAEANSAS